MYFAPSIFFCVNSGTKCAYGTEHIANGSVVEASMGKRDDDVDDAKVGCEWSYEEDTSRICNHVYEYQQMQMTENIEHIDKDDDRSQEGNAKETYDEEIIDETFTSHADKIKTFVLADDNSSRSNASSIIAQNEMKSEKAEAGPKDLKDYDYRVECEGKDTWKC